MNPRLLTKGLVFSVVLHHLCYLAGHGSIVGCVHEESENALIFVMTGRVS